jgi:hypothetical protein
VFALIAAIRQADTPKPIKARPSANSGTLCALANTMAPAPANSSKNASTRRGPQRSSATPNGTCAQANAKK